MQGTRKTREGDDYSDRDALFGRINQATEGYLAVGKQVVWGDANKKEIGLSMQETRGQRNVVHSIDDRLRTLPKAHLHLHLHHCVRQSTFLALARREGISLVSFYRFSSLTEFLARAGIVGACLTHPHDVRRLCYELVEDEAHDGVGYIEPMISFRRFVPQFGSINQVFRLIQASFREAERTFGVEVGVMVGFGRDNTTSAEAEELARFAAAYAGDGVVAFGFGGDETRVGPEAFAPACAIARAAGLLVVPHAGEVAGAEGVRRALDVLQPDRIAHGVRAVEDAHVMTRLRTEGVTCDICPTSNVRLGVVSGMMEHPIKDLLAAGVPVTLNADDPLDFDTTATREYTLVRDAFRLSDEHMARIAVTSVRASGASAKTKERMLQGIQRWIDDE